MRVVRATLLWAPVAAFLVLIFAATGEETGATVEPPWDKLLHVVAYGLFAVVCLRASHGGFRRPRPAPTFWGAALVVGTGALDEWNQVRHAARDASIGDWVADCVGAALALLVMFRVLRGRAEADPTIEP